MKVKDTNQMLCSIISYYVKWTSEMGHKIDTLCKMQYVYKKQAVVLGKVSTALVN